MGSVKRTTAWLALLLFLGTVWTGHARTQGPAAGPESFSYEVLGTYPHDPEAFTQGLAVDEGIMYEGTGLYGRSTLRRVDIKSGDVLQVHRLPDFIFGEGITVVGDRVLQLTWKSGFGFVYHKQTFQLQRIFTYPGEGWGLTDDGARLILSDGTAVLRYLDPATFEEIERVTVADDMGPVQHLNELEYIGGRIYANVYETDLIVIIDPVSGRVTGRADLSGLRGRAGMKNPEAVLNGIAPGPSEDTIYVTGKLWPRLFHIRLVPSNKRQEKRGEGKR